MSRFSIPTMLAASLLVAARATGGSPMLNRDAEIVGAAFDGNIESLPNEWLFSEDVARTVGVHSAGILEALRAIYRAEALVAELTGR